MIKKRYWYRTINKNKKCLLTLGEIREIVFQIAKLRSKKKYLESDKLRDRLVSVGYFYHSPHECKEINLGNLWGVFSNHLRFNIKKDLRGWEEISICGYVIFDDPKYFNAVRIFERSFIKYD